MATIFGAVSTLAFASSDFASPNCKTGCRYIDNIDSQGDQVYLGANEERYRICRHGTGYLVVGVGDSEISVPDATSHDTDCIGVSGKEIYIKGSASALVGAVGAH